MRKFSVRPTLTLRGRKFKGLRGWSGKPTHPPLTVRALATQFASLVGAPSPRLSEIPYPVFWATGLIVPIVRELRITRYQFVSPFVVDASLTETTFGLTPIDLAVALEAASAA